MIRRFWKTSVHWVTSSRMPSLFRTFLLLTLCISIAGCKSSPHPPSNENGPALVRLVDLLQNPSTRIDSFDTTGDDSTPVMDEGWKIDGDHATAVKKNVGLVLPKGASQGALYRISFRARAIGASSRPVKVM